MGLGTRGMPAHRRNPTYCGVCHSWHTSLSNHQLTKKHTRLYDKIKQRAAIKISPQEVSPPTIYESAA